MVDKVINGMIAGIVGAVAFVAIRALVTSAIYGEASNYTYEGPTNGAVCTANVSNCTWHDPTPAEMVIHDLLPIAIAIMVVAGLFLGLTHMRGV